MNASASSRVTPRGVWYLLPVALLLAGAVAGIVVLVSGIAAYSDTIDNFGRVPLNGEGTVTFAKSGSYTAYFEPEGGIDGPSYVEPAVYLKMTKQDTGKPVPFTTYNSESTYTSGEHEGRAINTFRITEPGTYVLRSTGQGSGQVAVGRSPFGKVARGAVFGAALGLAGFVPALILTIVLAVKRGRSKRAMRPAPLAGTGYGAPGYGYGRPPHGPPGYGSPGAGGPGYGAPGYGGPGYGAPGYGAPGYGAPGYGAPGYGAPGYGAPRYGAPGYGGPGSGTPGPGGPPPGVVSPPGAPPPPPGPPPDATSPWAAPPPGAPPPAPPAPPPGTPPGPPGT